MEGLKMLTFAILLCAAATAMPVSQLRDSDTSPSFSRGQNFQFFKNKFAEATEVLGENLKIGRLESADAIIVGVLNLNQTSENEAQLPKVAETEKFILLRKLRLFNPKSLLTSSEGLDETSLNEIRAKRSTAEKYPFEKVDAKQLNSDDRNEISSLENNEKLFESQLDLFGRKGIIQRATELLPYGRISNKKTENSSKKFNKAANPIKITRSASISPAELVKWTQDILVEIFKQHNTENWPQLDFNLQDSGQEERELHRHFDDKTSQGEALQERTRKIASAKRRSNGSSQANGLKPSSPPASDAPQQSGTEHQLSKREFPQRGSPTYRHLRDLLRQNARLLASKTTDKTTLRENYSLIEKYLGEIINGEIELTGLEAVEDGSSPFWDLGDDEDYEESTGSFIDDILPETLNVPSPHRSGTYKFRVRFLEDATGLKSKIERIKCHFKVCNMG